MVLVHQVTRAFLALVFQVTQGLQVYQALAVILV